MTSRLDDALSSLERRWQDLGVEIDSLTPGLEPAEVERGLEREGIPPHASLVSWFSWHNGSTEMYWLAVPTPLGPLSLGQSLENRRSFLAATEMRPPFLPTWVPILGSPSTDRIVADAISGELVRVDPWDAEAPVRASGYNLESAVSFFLNVLASVPLDFSSGHAEVDFGSLPEELQDSPLL